MFQNEAKERKSATSRRNVKEKSTDEVLCKDSEDTKDDAGAADRAAEGRERSIGQLQRPNGEFSVLKLAFIS